MNTAELLFSAYRAERRHSRNPYPRCSAGFAGARFVSRCHGTAVYENRKGVTLCVRCRQPCELSNLEARATPKRVTERWHGQTIDVPLMHVHPTRVVDRDAEDRAMVAGTWRWVALSRLVEPAPPDTDAERWGFVLSAWALVQDYGPTRAAKQGADLFGAVSAGRWTVDAMRHAQDQGRGVLARRAVQRPMFVETLLGRAVA